MNTETIVTATVEDYEAQWVSSTCPKCGTANDVPETALYIGEVDNYGAWEIVSTDEVLCWNAHNADCADCADTYKVAEGQDKVRHSRTCRCRDCD